MKGKMSPEDIIEVLRAYPKAAPFIFVVVTASALALLMPAALVAMLGAGIVWGWFWGGILSAIALGLGAAGAFFIARYVGQDSAEKYIKIKTWDWIQGEMEENSWKAVLLLRASQLVPFGIGSYFFGITKVSFLAYIIPTMAVWIPGAFIYTSLGETAGGLVLEGRVGDLVQKGIFGAIGITLLITCGHMLRKHMGKKKTIKTQEGTARNSH